MRNGFCTASWASRVVAVGGALALQLAAPVHGNPVKPVFDGRARAVIEEADCRSIEAWKSVASMFERGDGVPRSEIVSAAFYLMLAFSNPEFKPKADGMLQRMTPAQKTRLKKFLDSLALNDACIALAPALESHFRADPG